jgi:Protein of unknown function (DUF2029).
LYVTVDDSRKRLFKIKHPTLDWCGLFMSETIVDTRTDAVRRAETISATTRRSRSKHTELLFVIGFLYFASVVVMLCLNSKISAFGTLWASGRAASNGTNPYAEYPESFRVDLEELFRIPFPPFADKNLNPPWVLPPLQAISHLPIKRAKQVQVLLSGLCFAIGCLILITHQPAIRARQVLWLLMCMPTFLTLGSGQVYSWVFLVSALAWMFNKTGRLVAAGIAAGAIVAFRPTMIIWLLLLYLAGHRKIVGSSLVTICSLYALPVFIYGPKIYIEWFRAFANDQHWRDPTNIALMPLFMRHGHTVVGFAIASGILFLSCWWALRFRPSFNPVSGAGLCIGMVCGPLGWWLYILFVAPFFMVRRWTAMPMIAACFFLIPPRISPTLGTCYLVATLMMLAFFMLEPTSSRIDELQHSPVRS